MSPLNETLNATQVARIAVYDDLLSAPRVVEIQPTDIASYIEAIASKTYELASAKGSTIPYTVIREVSENFIHAQFKEVTVSILNDGRTIRFADQGPGIENKDRAQMPGFSSATADMKDYIRGVGSGLPIVKEYLKFSNGRLVIEDNIKDGTVITIGIEKSTGNQPIVYQEAPATAAAAPAASSPIDPATTPAFARSVQPKAPKLEERDLDVLALASEYDSIGPTDIKNSLSISQATAYRILNSLQEAGYLMPDEIHKGKRILTQLGLSALEG